MAGVNGPGRSNRFWDPRSECPRVSEGSPLLLHRLEVFEIKLQRLLAAAAPEGHFSEQAGPIGLCIRR